MLNDSSLIHRVRRFLREVPPFSYLTDSELESLARHTVIGVYHAGDVLFRTGDRTVGRFYLVKKGAVDILRPQEGTSVMVDKCGEADVFGIRPILADSPYELDAICAESSILYEIPIDRFQEVYLDNKAAVEFMLRRFAAGSVRGGAVSTGAQLLAGPTIVMRPVTGKVLITAVPEDSIQAVVETMSSKRISSVVIVDPEQRPLGIITDRDVRDLVARGYVPDLAARELMSAPVACVAPAVTLQEVQLEMIRKGMHHLCITADGTPETPGIGMVTEHDILYASASDPVVILKKIKRATTTQHLVEARRKLDDLLPAYLDTAVSRRITLSVIDTLNRSIIHKAVEIALVHHNQKAEVDLLETDFAFYNMGSAARGEQLMLTDQDNGMLVIDAHADRIGEYRQLGKGITDILHEIGYAYCPASMMASTPDWCTTVTEMRHKVTGWILEPGPEEVLHTAIFFDFRYEYGLEALCSEMQQHIVDLLDQQDMYLRFLAKQASLNPPPLSFFRKFIIEKDGAYKDQFDVKLRGISPLTDAARVLALDEGYLLSPSTLDRYDHLSQIDPANADIYTAAQESLLVLLATRLQASLADGGGGRYIDPDQISKLDRIQLRQAFEPGRHLIDMIERRYQLSYL